MNTQYRKNLKDVATACKNYTDKRFDDFKWELGTHTIDTATDSDVAYQKQAPNGTIGCQINSVGGMSYKSENLLVLPNNASTINGITFTPQSNGSIDIDGTATSTTFYLVVGNLNYNGNYYFKNFGLADSNSEVIRFRFIDSGESDIYCNINNVGGTISTITQFMLRIASGATYNHFKINPMLVTGSTAPTEFKQGFEGIRDSAVTSVVANSTLNIPAGIQALAGYGWGINDTCYNYIDFENKKFVQKVGRVDLGSLTWSITNHCFYATISNKKADSTLLLISNGYTELSGRYYASTLWPSSNDRVICCDFSTSSKIVIIKDTSLPEDAAAFKTAMSGVYLYYELANPVETDISSYITDNDKFLEVEPLGTITFNNTYEQEVPSEITYLTEVAK